MLFNDIEMGACTCFPSGPKGVTGKEGVDIG